MGMGKHTVDRPDGHHHTATGMQACKGGQQMAEFAAGAVALSASASDPPDPRDNTLRWCSRQWPKDAATVSMHTIMINIASEARQRVPPVPGPGGGWGPRQNSCPAPRL